jgi:site-specific DNA-adenine methylase
MKNHFLHSWFGNKRGEVKKIYENINFDNVEIIIEPFCGTSAISYYISTQQPKKFKYILNDTDPYLYEIYNTMKDEKQTDILQNEFNLLVDKFNEFKTDEEKRNYWFSNITKSNETKHIIFKKSYGGMGCMCPISKRAKQLNKKALKTKPIYNFMNTEDVEILNIDAVELIKKYKDNEKALIILDPPYLTSFMENIPSNYHEEEHPNIYEYLYYNDMNDWKSQPIIILEKIWIIYVLFPNKNFIEYDKKYAMKKKQTIHLIITKKYIPLI